MYYFHFLSYILIVQVDKVEPTHKGMQVLTHLVFYTILNFPSVTLYEHNPSETTKEFVHFLVGLLVMSYR